MYTAKNKSFCLVYYFINAFQHLELSLRVSYTCLAPIYAYFNFRSVSIKIFMKFDVLYT